MSYEKLAIGFDMNALKSKFKDILQTLNLYKIPSKQHQVADYSDVDKISVSKILFWKYFDNIPLILRNYKKTRQNENCHI